MLNLLSTYLAQNPFGNIQLPPGVDKYGSLTEGGLVNFLNNVLKFMVVIAGIYMLFNLILAGYQFMSAGGDSKAVGEAWAKIWQSLVGLLIVAGSFLLAALFGWLIFGDWNAILRPQIYTP
jgi:hypothetical protein